MTATRFASQPNMIDPTWFFFFMPLYLSVAPSPDAAFFFRRLVSLSFTLFHLTLHLHFTPTITLLSFILCLLLPAWPFCLLAGFICLRFPPNPSTSNKHFLSLLEFSLFLCLNKRFPLRLRSRRMFGLRTTRMVLFPSLTLSTTLNPLSPIVRSTLPIYLPVSNNPFLG